MNGKGVTFSPWERDLAVVALPALLVFGLCAFSPSIFVDGDTNWHLAAGRWILDHRSVPLVDPFSYTFQGRPWTSHEWLAEVLFALAHRLAGWSGVAVLTAAAAAGAMAVLAREMRAHLRPLPVLTAVAACFAMLGVVLLARPHVLALPLLALWTAGLMRASREGRSPNPWLLLVMLAWANMHAGYVMGFLTGGLFALEAFMAAPTERRAGTAMTWGAFLLAAAGASLLTPHGVEGWLFPFKVLALENLTTIEEWKSSNFSELGAFEVVLLATLFVCLYRGVRIGPPRLLFLLLLLHMALSQVRQVGVLAILAPLLLAEPLGRTLSTGQAERPPAPRPPVPVAWSALAAMAFLFLAVATARFLQPVTRTDSPAAPVAATASVPAALAAQPVFNDYAFGGWLIFKGVRPFIDGRADMYGDPFIDRYQAIARGDAAAFDRGMRDYRFRWTILRPDSRLAKLLDTRSDWRRLHADAHAVVHVYAPAAERRAPARLAGLRGSVM